METNAQQCDAYRTLRLGDLPVFVTRPVTYRYAKQMMRLKVSSYSWRAFPFPLDFDSAGKSFDGNGTGLE